MDNQETNLLHYKQINSSMISLFQYLFSIFVILVHSGRLVENELLHFTFKSVFARMAVPFFMICSSFFIRGYLTVHHRVGIYIRHLVKTYLFWSLIYLPYACFYLQSLPLPSHHPLIYLIGLVVALVYTGMCYQLWYIPAFLLGVWLVSQLLKFIGKIKTGILLFLLYLFGSIETYSAYLGHTPFFTAYQAYARILITSRNGIFYAPIFIFLGYLLYDFYQTNLFKNSYVWKVIACFALLCVEYILVFLRQGLDKNFFLGLPLFILFLFNAISRTSVFAKKDFSTLRKLSTLYFFIHPIFIEWTLFALRERSMSPAEKGSYLFFSSLICTHLVSTFMLKVKQWRIRHINRIR
ncbi:acyltransferase family protein [Streptococcus himalayensis]|uniref:acyltransferase family protein n=1 Tax=Streptococcus himalayensis TaxID=1888195 RepID=UPI00083E476C|nr:acyltransferase family protein [Streptococcus himalayensis]